MHELRGKCLQVIQVRRAHRRCYETWLVMALHPLWHVRMHHRHPQIKSQGVDQRLLSRTTIASNYGRSHLVHTERVTHAFANKFVEELVFRKNAVSNQVHVHPTH